MAAQDRAAYTAAEPQRTSTDDADRQARLDAVSAAALARAAADMAAALTAAQRSTP